MHRGTRCPLGFTRGRRARRQATPTDLARRRTARSRSIRSAHPETVPGLPWPRDRGSSYSTGSIWATIRKTIPRRNSTSLTTSQSDGSPTISETQTPQKHERELVTLEYTSIISQAARYHVPAIYHSPGVPRNGGLLSYSSDDADIYRGAASYVDRILRGAKPADLPVQQPTKFWLTVNAKTAKALGLTVPQSILLRADEVIQ